MARRTARLVLLASPSLLIVTGAEAGLLRCSGSGFFA
jgi:hypothetical protein